MFGDNPPALMPQASNNYRFANGFQGRMLNLKRNGGDPIKIEIESNEDIPKVDSLVFVLCLFNIL